MSETTITCPHCGATSAQRSASTGRAAVDIVTIPHAAAWAKCNACGASGPPCDTGVEAAQRFQKPQHYAAYAAGENAI